jgi:hypothetical protein
MLRALVHSLFRLSLGTLCVSTLATGTYGQEGRAPVQKGLSRPGPSVSLPRDVEQVLWWLPEDTEAILVSRGNVPIARSRRAESAATSTRKTPVLGSAGGYVYPTHKYNYEDVMAMHCIEPLVYFQALYPGDVRFTLMNTLYGPRTATLFVKAVRWRAGATRETCDIVLFSDTTATRIIESLSAFPNVSQSVADVRVLMVDLKSQPGAEPRSPSPQTDRRWLAAPQPGVYVAATSSSLIHIIIERMQRRSAARALSPDLPEWREVNLDAPAWGLRHYQPLNANEESFSMVKWDPRARGLVFFGGSTPLPFLAMRYLSSSEDAGARFRRMQGQWVRRSPIRQEDADSLPPFNRISADCVESRWRTNVAPEEVAAKPLRNLSVDATFFFCMDSMYLPWLGFPRP